MDSSLWDAAATAATATELLLLLLLLLMLMLLLLLGLGPPLQPRRREPREDPRGPLGSGRPFLGVRRGVVASPPNAKKSKVSKTLAGGFPDAALRAQSSLRRCCSSCCCCCCCCCWCSSCGEDEGRIISALWGCGWAPGIHERVDFPSFHQQLMYGVLG